MTYGNGIGTTSISTASISTASIGTAIRIPARVSASDHARTAATAILDALLPTKRRRKRHHPFSSSLSQTAHPDLLPNTSHFEHLTRAVSTSLSPHFSLTEFAPSPHHSSIPSPSFDTAFDTSPERVCILRIGHSSLLINLFGTIILTDPVLSESVGIEVFGKTIGIDRYTAPILDFEDIPAPDIVLLSHAHFDHTDLPTLRQFAAAYPDSTTVICAKNTRDVIDDLAWKYVHELDWDEDISIAGTTIRAVEVVHNGWRCPWERDRANGYTKSGRSYNAYFIERNGIKLVFGGDTAFTKQFESLRNEGINVAMMPIGAYQGYESLHCTPEQALAMARAMEAEYVIPMHFGTFYQSNEEPEEPLQRLLSAQSLFSPLLILTSPNESWSLPMYDVANV